MSVMTRQERGSLGGKRRVANQTAEQRREVARLGGQAYAAKKRAANDRARLDSAVSEIIERAAELSETERTSVLTAILRTIEGDGPVLSDLLQRVRFPA